MSDDRRRLRGLGGSDEDQAAARIANARLGRALRLAQVRTVEIAPTTIVPFAVIARRRDPKRSAMLTAAIACIVLLLIALFPARLVEDMGAPEGAAAAPDQPIVVTFIAPPPGGRGRTTATLPPVAAVAPSPTPTLAPTPPPLPESAREESLAANAPLAPVNPAVRGTGGSGTGTVGTGPGAGGSGNGAGTGNGIASPRPSPATPPPPPPPPYKAPPPPGFGRFAVHVTDAQNGYGVPDACVDNGALSCVSLLQHTDASGYWSTLFPLTTRTIVWDVRVEQLGYTSAYQRVYLNPVEFQIFEIQIRRR